MPPDALRIHSNGTTAYATTKQRRKTIVSNVYRAYGSELLCPCEEGEKVGSVMLVCATSFHRSCRRRCRRDVAIANVFRAAASQPARALTSAKLIKLHSLQAVPASKSPDVGRAQNVRAHRTGERRTTSSPHGYSSSFRMSAALVRTFSVGVQSYVPYTDRERRIGPRIHVRAPSFRLI